MASPRPFPGRDIALVKRALGSFNVGRTHMRDNLSKAGMVERLRCNRDRRVVSLQLTSKGKMILERAPQPLIGLVTYALEGLPENASNGCMGLDYTY